MKVKRKLVEVMYKDIKKEWNVEKKSMEDYIQTLEAAVNEWATKYEELAKKYQEDVTPREDVVGYMNHHIGNVPEEDYYEDEMKKEEHEPLEDEAKQTQNGYKQPMGFKQNITS